MNNLDSPRVLAPGVFFSTILEYGNLHQMRLATAFIEKYIQYLVADTD